MPCTTSSSRPDNVVVATFNYGRHTKTRALWQWDYGIVLRFDDISLPQSYQVHFANSDSVETAGIALGDADGVEIPRVYLMTGLPIYVWVYLSTGGDDGETVYAVTVPVQPRPKPEEIQPTPAEQTIIDQAIAALNTATERTAADVTAADLSAQEAAAQANRAEAAAALLANVHAEAETLPPGSEATARWEDDVLTLGIPSGAPGPRGEKGEDGEVTSAELARTLAGYTTKDAALRLGMLGAAININTASTQIEIPAQRVMCGQTRTNVQAVNVSYDRAKTFAVLLYNTATGAWRVVYSVNDQPAEAEYVFANWKLNNPAEASVNGMFTVDGYSPYYTPDDHGANLTDGLDDAIFSWWAYPLAVHYVGVQDKDYVGFTDSRGRQGVIARDNRTGHIDKHAFRKVRVDDHSAPAVTVMPDGRVLCAFSGHSETNYVSVYISSRPENVSDFGNEIRLTASLDTEMASYAQVIYLGGKYHLFWRTMVAGTQNIWKWYYRASSDGETWGAPVALIDAGTTQYYLRAAVYDDQHIKLFMQSNATLNDSDIRLGYINVATGEIYDKDKATSLGNLQALAAPIPFGSFGIYIPKGEYKLRLLAVRQGTDNSLVVCKRQSGARNITSYMRARGGVVTEHQMTYQGSDFGPSGYVNGAEIVGEDKIVLCLNNDTSWATSLYTFDGANFAGRRLAETPSGRIKMMRPSLTVGGNSVYVNRGYYSTASYTDFYTTLERVDIPTE